MTLRLVTVLLGLVGRASPRRADRGRRGFLQRAALVATALVVDPWGFLLRPRTAYASVCGPANECSQGWSAFCCTINGGANTCPDGSFAAGWWKVSSSAFCRGGDRYVVDCNRLPDQSCTCQCADGPCDRRRVCCNNFRYGQCNQQVAGVTEVVCRVVICTPPWEWDDTCTTTVRTDERTRDHTATCLNGENPSEIAVVYQDLGLVGSPLGAPVAEETDTAAGGRWRAYEHGAITLLAEFGVHFAAGPAGEAYRDSGGPDGPLGHLTGPMRTVAGGSVAPAEHGAAYGGPDGTGATLHGLIHADHQQRGGPDSWLGFPVGDIVAAPGDRRRAFFDSGWSLAADTVTGEVRLLPSDVELPDSSGSWPATAEVTRWAGADRVATAVAVSQQSHPQGAPMAVLAGAGALPDALGGGVLAGLQGGPVLLTAGDALSPATAEELRRLDVTQVVLVGGEAVIGQQVEQDVAHVLPEAEVRRLGGPDRYATAAVVAREVAQAGQRQGGQGTVLLASGVVLADALAAGPAAAAIAAPLLLTDPDRLAEPSSQALQDLDPGRVVVLGGTAAVSQAVVDEVEQLTGAEVVREGGRSRFETAAQVTLQYGPDEPDAVLLASGDGFADALAAGPAATATDSALLLVGEDDVPAATRRAIAELRPTLLIAVGGTASVSAVVLEQLAATPNEPYEEREPPSPSGDGEASEPPPLPAGP